MPLLDLLRIRLVQIVTEPRWSTIAISFGLYLGVSYIGYWALGESHLIADPSTFLYYMTVTGSTVGYGDLSPTTAGGKLLTGLWVILVGITILGYVLGKAATDIAHLVSKRKRGEHHSMKRHHIIVVGYNEDTPELVNRLLHECQGNHGIVVCADHRSPPQDPFNNPLVGYIRGETFSDYDLFTRAGIAHAKGVIVNTKDDIAMVCMVASSMVDSTKCSITAYVSNPTEGDMLEKHCPCVNVIPDLSQQIIAKASTDPGSEELVRSLVETGNGQTQYAMVIDAHTGIPEPISVENMTRLLRERFDAMFMGVRDTVVDGECPRLNPPMETLIRPGNIIYYIAPMRINTREFLNARREEYV